MDRGFYLFFENSLHHQVKMLNWSNLKIKFTKILRTRFNRIGLIKEVVEGVFGLFGICAVLRNPFFSLFMYLLSVGNREKTFRLFTRRENKRLA